uniref:NADPH--cytochrome P450 reductase n=1 Tax=Plectus sambesii TaxID=2011161 RepID=A0A914VWA6_9BILA
MWSIMSQLDTLDLAIFTAVIGMGVFFLYKYTLGAEKSSSYTPKIVPVQSTTIGRQQSSDDGSFVNRMKNGGRQIVIFYGSQTGTGEELAGRLAKDAHRYGLKALVVDPEEVEIDEFPRIAEIENSLVILCMATYGEGDPTDNAQQFHEYLQSGDHELQGIRYAVFGLGNKTYEHYNEVGIYFDKRLEELGAERVFELGMGDDDGNLEEDFMRWREAFWPAVAAKFGWEANETDGSERQYRLEIVEGDVAHFKGEVGRLGSFEKQRPPFDLKNPYLATIAINKELHASLSDRSCRHIEFDITGARVRYEAGDHAAVFPTNCSQLVEELGKLLNADMNVVFRLINTDEESSKKHPFPCPCSYRTALTHYVDITSPIKSHVLKALAEYATDEAEKQRLLLLSTASEEGLKEYGRYIQKERRSIIDVLREFPSCKPPIDHVLELLPKLQARYYSISSSPKTDPGRVAVTAVVLRYGIGDRLIKGVCTNYLADKLPSEDPAAAPKIPIFVRKSTVRLPHRTTTPVIMIGPGTGFAPFRGFIQERAHQKEQGKEIGPMILYFGCRHRDHDYIYQDELEKYVNDGVLTELHVAFSRHSQEQKVYVQHKLWENRQTTWDLMEQGAHIYVCGDARNMARDVQAMFIKIAMELGGKTEEEATKFIKELERQKRYQADVWS